MDAPDEHGIIDDEEEEEDESVITIEQVNINVTCVQLCHKLEELNIIGISEYDFHLQDNKLVPNKSIISQCNLVEGAAKQTKLINVKLYIEPEARRVNIIDILKPPDNNNQHQPQHQQHQQQYNINNSNNITTTHTHNTHATHINNNNSNNIGPNTHTNNRHHHNHHTIKQEQQQDHIACSGGGGSSSSGGGAGGGGGTAGLIDGGGGGGGHHHVAHGPGTGTLASNTTQEQNHKRLMGFKASSNQNSSPGTRTGNNGQIQLWQFLLELLTDADCRDYIQWIGTDGEFKLNNPEGVAHLWGLRKNKPTMNYEKLSRALRYYYDGDMIAKVHGKRFVYKFVCDLKSLIGYDARELDRLVSQTKNKRNSAPAATNVI